LKYIVTGGRIPSRFVDETGNHHPVLQTIQ
jgi:hypothetical protein